MQTQVIAQLNNVMLQVVQLKHQQMCQTWERKLICMRMICPKKSPPHEHDNPITNLNTNPISKPNPNT